ncbi:MBL fold metallo-hydrolase [Haloglycomyces albus]|uniref:MBL fold metallo-hydrolase n=1 Tax=Haloglycomyces albus TaxID=526067 RepID=UPI00046D890B|nr:MBL fold metallo-hydrolase [Haloglycomyces albus]
MKLTIIGCAGSFPAPDTPCSAYLVEADGYKLLLDYGTGALGELQKYTDPNSIDAIIITHLHADHFFDACAYAVMRRYGPNAPDHPVPLYGPSATADRIRQSYGGHGELKSPCMTDVYDFHTLQPGGFHLGPFSIRVDRVAHPVETFGVRVEHNGSSLTYTSDSGPCESLEKLAYQSDTLLAEASYLEGRVNPPDVHLTGKEAGEFAAKAGARQLLLTHLVEPWGSADTTLNEARSAYSGPTSIVKPGETYQV